MIGKIECKNSEKIKQMILLKLDQSDYIDADDFTLEELLNDPEIYNEFIEIIDSLNILYIVYMQFSDGGFDFISNDFKLHLEREDEESEHYLDLAKMYTILANKDSYDLYINSYC